MATELLARDAESRALMQSAHETVEALLGRVDKTVASIRDGQTAVAANLKENTRTLHLPVRPVYDAAGRLVEARRVDKREDES
jgi:hypothetical protein